MNKYLNPSAQPDAALKIKIIDFGFSKTLSLFPE